MLKELELAVHHEIKDCQTNIVLSYLKDEKSTCKGFYINLDKDVLGYRAHLGEEAAKQLIEYLQGYLIASHQILPKIVAPSCS